MTITVTAPNGATVDFPDGTGHDVINNVMRQHFGNAQPSASPSVPAGLLRAAASGLTFGLDDEIAGGVSALTGGSYAEGAASARDAKKKFADEHPWLSMGAEAAGALPTMFIPGMGAARAVQAGRAAATTGQFVGQGAKIGAKYGAVSGVGNADPTAQQDTFASLMQRLMGGAGGAALGAGVGAGVGLVAKGANTAASALLPGLREGSGAAGMLAEGAAGDAATLQRALKDIALELRRDAVDPQQLVRGMLPAYKGRGGTLNPDQIERVVAGHLGGETAGALATDLGVSPAAVSTMINRFESEIAPRFRGSNLLEVMRTPAKPGDVVTIPNTTDLAHVAATSEGRGRQVAMQAIRQRQADMGDEASTLIDKTFKSDNFDDFARKFKTDTADAARNAYANVHRPAGTVLSLSDPQLANLARDPVFQRAVDFAARDAMQRNGGEPLAASILAGNLDARAVDMVQRQLRLTGQGLSDPNAGQLANTMRQRLLTEADKAMPGFWDARGWYRTRMDAEEALDLGRKLGVKAGNSGGEASQMWRKYSGMAAELDKEIARLNRTVGMTPTGRASTAGPRGTPDQVGPGLPRLAMAKAEREQIETVLENFRRGFGQSLKDFLDKGGNADQFLRGAEARVFRQRVVDILGPKEASPFIADIDRMIRQKQTGQALYGNSDTAARTAKRGSLNALMDTAAGVATLNPMRVLRGAGDMVTNRLREARYDRINAMLSETDIKQVFNLARTLRDHMARSQLPNARPFGDAVLRYIDRLPAPARDYVRKQLGDEVRGQDLLTFMSGILANRQVANTYRGT